MAALQGASGLDVGGQVRITEDHPAQSDGVDMTGGDLRRCHGRKPFLEVRVGRTHQHQIWELSLGLGDGLDLARHAHQRIFRGQVAVAGRCHGRALEVGVVVGAGRGEANQPDSQRFQQPQEGEGFREIHLEGVVRIGPEGVRILPGPRRGSTDAIGALLEGEAIEQTQAHADGQPGGIAPDARHDLGEEAGSVREGAPVAAGPGDRGEELVAQITVAVLDVHEVEARPLGSDGRGDHVGNEFVHLGVAQDRTVVGDAESGVEQRVAVGNARFEAGFVVGAGEAARVRELKPHQKIPVLAMQFQVCRHQFGS